MTRRRFGKNVIRGYAGKAVKAAIAKMYCIIKMIHCESETFQMKDIQCFVKQDRNSFRNSFVTINLIYHDNASYTNARAIAGQKDYYNLIHIPTTKYFESIIFYDQVFQITPKDTDYIGFITYKFNKFVVQDDTQLMRAMHQHPDFDIYILFPSDRYAKEEITSGHSHDAWMAFESLTKRLGLQDAANAAVFWRNYWIGKRDIVKEFSLLVTRAILLVETDEALGKQFMGNSMYPGALLKDQDRLLKITNRPWYTYHPFLFERLICAFVHHHKLRVFDVAKLK